MKVTLAVMGMILFAIPALAQETPEHEVPLVRCGFLVGRSGVAFGPSGYCEVNPFHRWFGVYGIIGKSRVDGYRTRGVIAGVEDLSAGVGFVSRPLRFNRFLIGGFVQATYSGDKIHASFPDGYGGMVQYSNTDSDPLVTVGPDIEYRIPRLPLSVIVRPGKNFGGGLAAHTAGGFSLNGGLAIERPIHLLKKLF